MSCIVCGTGTLTAINGYSDLSRITSDCRPFEKGGALFKCSQCLAVQKSDSPAWRLDCEKIYKSYDVYSVSAGLEQSVRGGGAESVYGRRSDIVLSEAEKLLTLPEQGRFLDFGCGSGVSSSAASDRFTGWSIDGFDLDTRQEETLGKIGGFEKLFVGDPKDIDEKYDLIMLTHVLEHVPDPSETLRTLSKLLTANGAIIVQVPDRANNPYDLLVADHLMHFDLDSLSSVCRRSALTVLSLANDWVMKELSLVAVSRDEGLPDAGLAKHTLADPEAHIAWLRSVGKFCSEHREKRPLGIFGTSLVATWMTEELGRAPDFYLDEDPAKIGQALGGVEILSPPDAPAHSVVIPAMASAVARLVASRYQDKDFLFAFVPDFDERTKS